MHERSPHDLLASHGASLRALARHLVRDTQRAEDLVQDTLAAALARPPARGGDLRGWLATALARRASNVRRGEARRTLRERTVARAEALRGADTVASEVELAKRLAAHVDALAPPLREALFLRYFEDSATRHIAARLGVPLSTVKSRLERGLAELRSRLDADAEGRREEWLGAALVWSMPRRSVSHTVVLGAGALTIVGIVAASPLLTRSELARSSPLSSGVPHMREQTSLALTERDSLQESPRVDAVAAMADQEDLVLRGIVLDMDLGAEQGTGRPAAGATVWFHSGAGFLHTTAGEAQVPRRRTTTTDVAGRFELTIPRAQRTARFAQVWVDGTTDLRSASSQPRDGFDASEGAEVRLLRYPFGALEGRVVDTNGVAVAGVPVRLRWTPLGREGTAVSAHDGRFRFEKVRSEKRVEPIVEQADRVLAWAV